MTEAEHLEQEYRTTKARSDRLKKEALRTHRLYAKDKLAALRGRVARTPEELAAKYEAIYHHAIWDKARQSQIRAEHNTMWARAKSAWNNEKLRAMREASSSAEERDNPPARNQKPTEIVQAPHFIPVDGQAGPKGWHWSVGEQKWLPNKD